MFQEKNIHFFDIDGTLLNVDSKVWLVDKEDTSKPILKLNNFDVNKILNGIYIKDGLKIQYNDKEYFISKYIFDKINKRKKYPIERLGLSWVEFTNSDYVDNLDISFIVDNISHVNKEDKICLLTGRSNRKNNEKILKKLIDELKNIGLEMFKVYFISDTFQERTTEQTNKNKAIILLEHMIGLKIKNDKFVALKQDKYNNVYFYDDDLTNITYANKIQELFDMIIRNTDDELFKYVNKTIQKNDSTLITNWISNNQHNKFLTNKIELKQIVKYPLQKESVFIKEFKKFIDKL